VIKFLLRLKSHQNLLLKQISWNLFWLANFPNYLWHSIKFRSQIKNQVSNYRLLGTFCILPDVAFYRRLCFISRKSLRTPLLSVLWFFSMVPLDWIFSTRPTVYRYIPNGCAFLLYVTPSELKEMTISFRSIGNSEVFPAKLLPEIVWQWENSRGAHWNLSPG